jgi:chitinase
VHPSPFHAPAHTAPTHVTNRARLTAWTRPATWTHSAIWTPPALWPARRAALAFCAAALLAGGGLMGAAAAAASATRPGAGQSQAVQPAAALSANWYESAPYYSTLDSSGPNLSQVMSATGTKAFDLAFILSGSGCAATWDGTDPVAGDTQVAATISQIRSAGGDVIVSAGGFNGTKLGQTCSSASATAAAYQSVISTYGLHAFDFDLEEPEIENSTAIANELGAAQILQRDNPGLFVSVTIPSTTTGANFFGQQLLTEAKSLGFTPDDYTIMPFDGGFSGASSQITALQDFHSQLMSTFGWSSAQAFAHEGFSGMNGRTDSAEIFTQADFGSVLSFAESNGMSRYTFWSVNRDRECTPVDNGFTSSECSSIAQNPWDFTADTVAFAGHAPVPSPSPTPTPTQPSPSPTPTPPGGGCTAPGWVTNTAYVAGSVVSFNGIKWTANQWNYNEAPGGPAGAWDNDGPC